METAERKIERLDEQAQIIISKKLVQLSSDAEDGVCHVRSPIKQTNALCSLKPLPNAANSRDTIPIKPIANAEINRRRWHNYMS